MACNANLRYFTSVTVLPALMSVSRIRKTIPGDPGQISIVTRVIFSNCYICIQVPQFAISSTTANHEAASGWITLGIRPAELQSIYAFFFPGVLRIIFPSTSLRAHQFLLPFCTFTSANRSRHIIQRPASEATKGKKEKRREVPAFTSNMIVGHTDFALFSLRVGGPYRVPSMWETGGCPTNCEQYIDWLRYRQT